MIIARYTSAHWLACPRASAAETEPDVSCRISPSVRISLLAGGCWAVQKRAKGKWASVGYHSSFYHAADWLLRQRPDLLVSGELGHMDSLLRAHDVALARLRAMAEPISEENQQLRAENEQLKSQLARLQKVSSQSPAEGGATSAPRRAAQELTRN